MTRGNSPTPVKKAAMELGDLLFQRHPKTFIHPRLKGKGMRPLKIGIDKDIKAAYPDVPKRIISLFLNWYVASHHYKRCGTMVGTVRVDLSGDAISVVIPEHARHSERHLARIADRDPHAANAKCPATGKIGFESAAEAASVGRETISRSGGDLGTAIGYRCRDCGKFHWGNRLPPTNGLR